MKNLGGPAVEQDGVEAVTLRVGLEFWVLSFELLRGGMLWNLSTAWLTSWPST